MGYHYKTTNDRPDRLPQVVIEWHPFWGNQTMQVNGDFKGFSLFFFHPYLGKIPILTNIIQWG